MHRSIVSVLCLILVSVLCVPASTAQFSKLKRKAKQRVEREADRQMDKGLDSIEDAVRCSVDDTGCIEEAENKGQPVVLTDDTGNVVSAPPDDKPGEGVWANYDFVPGDRVLFADDFSKDRVGDFPRRMEFLRGTMEVVEWKGSRYLRTSQHGDLNIHIDEPLPERFTIEFDYHQSTGVKYARLFTSPVERSISQYPGSFFTLGNRSGIDGPRPSMLATKKTKEGVVPVRIQVDGSHAKMYLNEQRVANVPNAAIVRSSTIQLRIDGTPANPAYIGHVRIASGGRDMYDALKEKGRVTTRGILFDTNSARIRPESTPSLEEIARMLQEHPDLSISIEGHTDSVGDDAYNQRLSERRAGAVRTYLAENRGIDESRLESKGFGESQPVGDNDTEEGRQNNRRVELVDLSR